MKNSNSKVYSSARPARILSIEISVVSLKLAGFESTRKGLHLLCYEIKTISSDHSFAEQGEKHIKDFITKYRRKLGRFSVILTISQVEGVFIKYLEMPEMPVDEIISAANWQMKEEAPFDVETATVDYQKVLETKDNQGVKQIGYIFCSVQKEILEAYLEILENCRLLPARITIRSVEYAQIILEKGGKEQIAVCLDINENNTFLNIYWNHQLAFLRNLPLSWGKVVLALKSPFDTDKETMQLSDADIERIKNMPGLLTGDTEVFAQDLKTMHATSIIRPFLETLVREIKFSIAYFGTTAGGEKPQILYITGSVSDLKDFESYLKKELEVDVCVLQPPSSVIVSKPLRQAMTGHMKVVLPLIGAALNGWDGLNLLPENIKNQKAQQSKTMFLRLVTLMILSVLFLLTGFTYLQQRDLQHQIENARVHLQALDAIKRMNVRIVARENLWNKILRNKVPGTMVLRVISHVVPPAIVLDQLSFDQTGREVRISGMLTVTPATKGDNQLIDFVQQLDESPLFVSATLLSTKRSPGADLFEISCSLASGI